MDNKKILKYSEDDMHRALEAIKSGMPISSASKLYKVPRTTLLYKHTGKYPIKRKMGPDTILSKKEEKSLVQWMFHVAKAGFPVTKDQLLDSVQLLMKETKKSNPFVNDRPGRHWFENFQRRHPEVSLRTPSNICGSRGALTENQIKSWFKEIEEFLKTTGNFEILQNGNRVFNMDESAFFLCPKGDRVFVQKGQKCVYNFNQNDEKECLTVLLGGNATGLQTPPMVIFSYERIPATIALLMPSNWSIGKSENGWMTSANFFEYIVNVFYPWIKNQNIDFPIIVFVDGHKSHLTFALSEFCKEHEIILVALYPNATHLLQPMDVAVFKPLKTAWKKSVLEFKTQNNGKKLKRENFAPLLQTTLNKTITPDMFINGFRRCGLYPFNKEAVDYSRILTNFQITEMSLENNEESNKFLTFLEKRLENKLPLFRNCKNGIWMGNTEDKCLYEFWKKLNDESTARVNTTTINKKTNEEHIETQNYATGDGEECNVDQNCMIEEEYNENQNSTTGEEQNENQNCTNLNNLINEANVIQCTVDKEGYLVLENCYPVTSDFENRDFDQRLTCSATRGNSDLNSSKVVHVNSQHEDCNTNSMVFQGNCIEDISMQNNNSENENFATNSRTNTNIEIFNQHESTPEKTAILFDNSSTHLVNKTTRLDPNIPSPFKRVLFWPQSETKEVKKRKKEKIPSVATSQQWINYYKKKEDEKRKVEEQKLEKKRKREEKRQSTKSSKCSNN